ncbi:MAG: hypothetical protein JNK21_05740 [Rhodospirillaceae bacterium]|nr:hypothetical protein [Rhodospirillaceae bacterium]
MKPVRVIFIASVALILGGLKAPPEGSLQGIDLARSCRSEAADDQSLCRGFIEGFTYGSQMAVGPEFVGQWRYGAQTWCLPVGENTQKLRDTFLTHAQANTGTLHFPAAIVLANAFATQYPCR